MKIIRIIFLSFLALSLIACTGIFIFFETFDTDQYLPQITKKASLALGRPVSIGHLGLGLSQRGITLDAWPLTVADDPDFTTQPFIKVDRVRISLDLRTLIFQREIHITEILLQSPQIHFIRSAQGNINVRSVAQASLPAGDNTAVKRPNVDVVASPSSSVVASLKGEAISERTTNSVEIASSLKSTPRSSYRTLPVGRNDILKSIRIQDGAISFIDQSQGMPLDIWLSDINASVNDLSLFKPFRLSFDASLYSNDPNVQGSALVFLDLSKRSVRISNLSLHTDFSHLDIDRLKGISPQMPDSPIFKNIAGGAVQLNMAHLDIGVPGDFEANGNIIVTDAVIKDFNIIKTVLSYTLGVFGSMGSFFDKLGVNDTVVEKAEAEFAFHDKTVFIDHSLIKSNIFEFTAKGSVDQGLNMDMQTMLHLNGDISAALINEFDGFKYLMDDSKRISIDASLKGVIPHLKYKPNKDFRKKSKKALMEEGGNILGALLGGGQSSGQGQDTSSKDSGKKKKSKNKFKDIFKSFLK